MSLREDNGSTTQHERRIITSVFRSIDLGEDLAGNLRSRNRHPGTLTNQDFMGENVGIQGGMNYQQHCFFLGRKLGFQLGCPPSQ